MKAYGYGLFFILLFPIFVPGCQYLSPTMQGILIEELYITDEPSQVIANITYILKSDINKRNETIQIALEMTPQESLIEITSGESSSVTRLETIDSLLVGERKGLNFSIFENGVILSSLDINETYNSLEVHSESDIPEKYQLLEIIKGFDQIILNGIIWRFNEIVIGTSGEKYFFSYNLTNHSIMSLKFSGVTETSEFFFWNDINQYDFEVFKGIPVIRFESRDCVGESIAHYSSEGWVWMNIGDIIGTPTRHTIDEINQRILYNSLLVDSNTNRIINSIVEYSLEDKTLTEFVLSNDTADDILNRFTSKSENRLSLETQLVFFSLIVTILIYRRLIRLKN